MSDDDRPPARPIRREVLEQYLEQMQEGPFLDETGTAATPIINAQHRLSELAPLGPCPSGPHREPQGPNEDVSVCPDCWELTYVLRPAGETYGDHASDCSLPIRHEGHCQPGGAGHPSAPVIRGMQSAPAEPAEPAEQENR